MPPPCGGVGVVDPWRKRIFRMVLAIVARFRHTVSVGNSVGTDSEGATNEGRGN
jgi:hypothetical protein